MWRKGKSKQTKTVNFPLGAYSSNDSKNESKQIKTVNFPLGAYSSNDSKNECHIEHMQ